MLNVILGPLLNASPVVRSTRRFMLTDLIWLVLQLQIAMAIAAAVFPRNMPTNIRVWALVLLTLPVLAFWYGSLQAVSGAGITRPLRRAAVFLVILPGGAILILMTPLLFLAILAQGTPFAFLQFAISLGCTIGVRWLCAWAVSDR